MRRTCVFISSVKRDNSFRIILGISFFEERSSEFFVQFSQRKHEDIYDDGDLYDLQFRALLRTISTYSYN